MAAVEGVPDPRVAGAVSSYFEAISTRAEPAWLALFADDAVVHDPVGSSPAEGRAALAEVWRMLQVPFEKLVLDPVHTFYGGNGAAVKWTGHGHGITGQEVEFEGISIFEVNLDGRIQTLMSYWDPAAMMIELAETD
ncbi:MAG: nuclear transport factor 2 family protein [Candidatus Binatia bacterium]